MIPVVIGLRSLCPKKGLTPSVALEKGSQAAGNLSLLHSMSNRPTARQPATFTWTCLLGALGSISFHGM